MDEGIRDLKPAEQLGSGVPRNFGYFHRDGFTFLDNFLRMAFPALEVEYFEATPQVSLQVDQLVKKIEKRSAGSLHPTRYLLRGRPPWA
ncbi:MAG: hypothetical protein EA390_03945 [Balneolaceae bacterium]|nr:MAG: hypothetical protein EA390_03945 [Balneolaceae bacterium]